MTYKQLFQIVSDYQKNAEPNRRAESERFYRIAQAMHKDGALIEADYYLRQSIIPLLTSRSSEIYKALATVSETINNRRVSAE